MTEHFPIMAPGVRPAGERQAVSSYDGAVLATVETMEAEGVDAALATAYALFRDRGEWHSGPRRVAILEKTAEIMQQRAEDLAMGAATEGGKPLADSRVEVARAVDGVKLCIESLRRDTGHEIPMGMTESSRHRLAVTRREPIGVEAAVAGGGRLLCGGKVLDQNCYAPTVILDPPPDAVISRNEVFGPVVCVYAYEDVKDAFERANGLDVAFQAAVFTRDLDFAMRCYRELDGAAVMVNDHTAFRVDWMPFAGLRHSGHGVGGIEHSFRDMTIEKMLVIRSRALP